MAMTSAGPLDLQGEWDRQYQQLEAQLADRSWCGRVVGEVEHPASLFPSTDGDPLEVTTQVQRAWIAGREIDLSNRHQALYEKYNARPGPSAVNPH